MAAVTSLDGAKRIVIKIGSALLVDRENHVLKREWLATLAQDVAALRERGVDVVIVSSGSIALGREIMGLPAGPLSLEQSQACASIGQIALAQAYRDILSPYGIVTAQILLTSEDSQARRRYLNTKACLREILSMGAVPIVNENDTVATDEIRFGDNDRLAAQVAVMAEADLLILLSDVDGLYTGNPRVDPNARHFDVVHEITPEIEAMASGAGTAGAKGGMTTKLIAGKTAMLGGVSMVITIGDKANPIAALREGAKATWFIANTTPLDARQNWISAIMAQGSIVIDDGACKAITRGSSILAAGCVAIEGEFERGDAINIKNKDGIVVGRGLAGYDSIEAEKILGCRTEEIEARLNYSGRGAMVHRDNFILV